MDEVKSIRILSHGKVEDLKKGFKLEDGSSFSVYVRQKKINTMDSNVLLTCKLIGDKGASPLPVPIGDWSPAMITEISPGAISLDEYEVYWGSGKVF